MRKLRKVPDHAWIRWSGGVCAGLAYALGIPAWPIRLVLAVGILFYGVGLIPYALLWVFMPTWPKGNPADYAEITGA